MNGPSEVFGLWASGKKFLRERITVECPVYAASRHALNQVIATLIRTGDDRAIVVIADLLKIRREMDSTPTAFDDSLRQRIEGIIGRRDSLMMRWGESACKAYDRLLAEYDALARAGNALRDTLKSAISVGDGHPEAGGVAVYCRRASLGDFGAVFDHRVQFLHSPAQYRSHGVFDTLVVQGGLRRSAGGSAPDAILLAPHYRHLVQVMWAVDMDEPDVGHLATTLGFNIHHFWEVHERSVICDHHDCVGRGAPARDAETEETLNFWVTEHTRSVPRVGDTVLLALGGGKGLVLRGGERRMVFNPEDRTVAEKVAHEVERGEIVLDYEGEIDFGEDAKIDDPLVRKWRNDIRDACQRDAKQFLGALKQHGVGLKGLSICVDGWTRDRRPKSWPTLDAVCTALGWSQRDAAKLWRIFIKHHGDAIRNGYVERELERETIERWVCSGRIAERLTTLAEHGSGQQLFDISVGGDTLVLKAFVVEEVVQAVTIDEGMIGKVIPIGELLK